MKRDVKPASHLNCLAWISRHSARRRRGMPAREPPELSGTLLIAGRARAVGGFRARPRDSWTRVEPSRRGLVHSPAHRQPPGGATHDLCEQPKTRIEVTPLQVVEGADTLHHS